MSDYAKLPAKKSLGQHFLTSPVVPNWMCDAAAIKSKDLVVEIGPGTGVLTAVLLERGASVIALEADSRAIAILEDTFPEAIAQKKLRLIHTDVRTLSLTTITELRDHQFKVVANIPYYLSGLLFRLFLESPLQPNCLVYLVQKEVAKRATTRLEHGAKESLLSLSVKAYGEPHYIKTVLRGHFTPPPKVDSGIIAITNISRRHFTKQSEAFFFTTLKLGFGQKRKQLLGNLTAKFPRAQLLRLFTELNLSPTIRAEDMSIETWLTLTAVLEERENT